MAVMEFMTLEQQRGFTEVFSRFDRKGEGACLAGKSQRRSCMGFVVATLVVGRVTVLTWCRRSPGRIDAKELGTILRALGQNPTPAEIQDIIAEVDTDGSGKMDLAEFMNMMAGSLRDTDKQEEVRSAFQFLDKDGNGTVRATRAVRTCSSYAWGYSAGVWLVLVRCASALLNAVSVCWLADADLGS